MSHTYNPKNAADALFPETPPIRSIDFKTGQNGLLASLKVTEDRKAVAISIKEQEFEHFDCLQMAHMFTALAEKLPKLPIR
jgi:hypothetical protein